MSGIGIKEVAFVGYPVSDFDQTREFYGELLGLKGGMILEEEGKVHWMEFEAGRVTIGLGMAGPHWEPGPQGGGACFEVEDLDGALEKLRAAGVTISFEIQNYPICRIAGIADPAGTGNVLHQKKPNHPDLQ
ncbi:MAG: VOC family protein [Akkermansiaceae bacterium]